MKTEELIIDCDGHILEPPDLWEKYLEPKYRDRAIRIRVGDDGYEYLEVAGNRAKMTRQGQLGTLGGMGKLVEEARRRREQFISAGRASELRYEKPKPEETYLKGAAFGTMDMKERLQLLDKEGMAKSILYPTIGLLWECETMDAELSAAYATAYNRWIADFCHDSGGRLVPIAHLSLGDPEAAARACGFGTRSHLRDRAGGGNSLRNPSDDRTARARRASSIRGFFLGRLVL